MLERENNPSVVEDFRYWNGWGPPTSEYQIREYCKRNTDNLEESEKAFCILKTWMKENKV